MTPDELRSKYLSFFEKRGHAIVPSSALVPENDPSTLFTGSGMQPMVPYLLGQEHPKGSRIVDSQKCFRSQDIEEVGDNRHTTFFEMLGNWSLGDYFKKEQIEWVFEFLTKEVGLHPERLFITVFAGNEQLGIGKDEESIAIWQKLFRENNIQSIDAKVVDNSETVGLQDGRIFPYSEKKNWWSRAGVTANMPVGEPGGPDTEVFYDFGAQLKLHENSQWKGEPCHVNCDCGRFLEIGNSVFMQFQKQADGSFQPLAKQNVDFGGGLERILAVAQNTQDVFETELFTPLISQLESVSGKRYAESEETKRSFRVIADHIKAAVMLASDGVYPSNKAQGYFSRRLVRRSVRFGKMIGIDGLFIGELVPIVAEIYKKQYPEVTEKLDQITKILVEEEQKFEKALQKGMKELDKVAKLDGEVAFKLYETYGFPFELTQEIALERGDTVSQSDFDAAKTAHSQASRTASVGMFKGGLQDQSEQTTRFHTATHLLHAALRKTLGSHVQQMGSNITAERLRFDFAHPQALTESEKSEVIHQVNAWIAAALPMTRQVMNKDEALAQGALAFFGEKYPDEVSVYTVGKDPTSDWISKELCGGPHVQNTGEIGELVIQKEKAVGQGVRRIYLVAKNQ